MSTKKEMQDKIDFLEESIAAMRGGHNISNCNIDMGPAMEAKIAVANAVSEGMKALQSSGDAYGIYLES